MLDVTPLSFFSTEMESAYVISYKEKELRSYLSSRTIGRLASHMIFLAFEITGNINCWL